MRLFILFLLLLAGLPGRAQLSLPDVEAAFLYAKEHNPQLAAAQQQAGAVAEEKNKQRAALLPQLKAVSSLDYYFSLPVQLIPAEFLGGEAGTYREVRFGQPYVLNLGVEASLPLINSSLWIGKQEAIEEAKAAAIRLEQVELRTADALAKAYYLTLLSREAIQLAHNTDAANDSLLLQAQHKLSNGLSEPLEVNRLRKLKLESAQSLAGNKAAYANNLGYLKVLLGLHKNDELLLTEQLMQKQEKAIQSPDYAYSRLPEYRLKESQLQQQKLALQRQRGKLLPELSAYGRYSQQAQRNTFNFAASSHPWFTIGTAGLRLEWPLFTGLYRSAAIRQASMRHEAARLELQGEAQRLEQEQQQLATNSLRSQQSLHYAQEAYLLGRENYRLARLKYTAGVFSLDQLLNVYHEQLRAQNSLLQALADNLYYQALIISRNSF